jgi:uncharacterized Fe-S cluster-containing radical SAM superfamily protein
MHMSSADSGRDFTDDPADEKDERRIRERLEKLIPDVVRRAVYAGATALFTTEDGIRRLASEFHLPKDVAAYLLAQAASSKDEVLRIIGQEVRRSLETINLSGELQKLLTSLSFEIKTEIRFIPNDEAVGTVKPDIKNRVAVKRSKDKNTKDEE